MRTRATPLEVAYVATLFAAKTTPQIGQSATNGPQDGAETQDTVSILIQTEEKYISRMAFTAALYGDGERVEIFIDDDIVLTIPKPFQWDAWFGHTRPAFFSAITVRLIDDMALQTVCFRAQTETGIAALRTQIVAWLPHIRYSLRARNAGIPLTRIPRETVATYLTGQASPLEIALAYSDCHELIHESDVI